MSYSWVAAEKLPLELYLGAGLLFSVAFFIFNSIVNNADNEEQHDGENDDSNNNNNNQSKDNNTNEYKVNICCLCCKGTCAALKILCKLNKCFRKCKKCKKSRTVDIEQDVEVIKGRNLNSNDASNITTFSYNQDFVNMGGSNCELRTNNQTTGDNVSSNKMGNNDRQKSSYRHYSFNVEEESLTQIVIAQIEHSNKQQLKEIQDNPETSFKTSANNDNSQKVVTSTSQSNSPKLIDQTLIEGKVDVTSSMVNQTTDCDPIYDVPPNMPNKSLIILSSTSKSKNSTDNRTTNQTDLKPLDTSVVHTSSSPNIVLQLQCDENDVYDTPSVQSMAI